MNTSHLDNIEFRLSDKAELRGREPDLYIAKKLSSDKASPLYKIVYEGGVRPKDALIPLRTLRTGLEYMLSRPTRLTALDDADAQYKVTKNYLEAVKRWIPEAWKKPKEYVALRGAGLWGIFFIGADVIDRALRDGNFSPDAMLKILKSEKTGIGETRAISRGLAVVGEP